MKVITQALVRQHLSMEIASSLVATGFQHLRSEIIYNGDRTVFSPTNHYPVIGFMPASDREFLSAKIACVSYDNYGRGLDSHQGAILLFEKPTGSVRAIIDATELTAIRTTAVTHFALGKLTSKIRKIRRVAILGTGAQAYHHIKMLSKSFNVSNFVVVSRSLERFQAIREQFGTDLKIEYRNYGVALKDCELLVLATHGEQIVLTLDQVGPTTLIFALGACRSGAQEVANDILDQCRFIADSFRSCAKSSGEGQYIANKAVGDYLELADLDTLSLGFHEDDLTVVKTVGLGFEDLVCARFLYESLSSSREAIDISDFGGSRAY